MTLRTASETISFVKALEEQSADFYEDLSQRHSADKDLFLAYAKENRKFASQIQRTYCSVISDAIEGCYAFDLNAADYALDLDLSTGAAFAEALDRALRMEERILDFYAAAAEQSMSLMADVPRHFKIVARKRQNRIPALKGRVSQED